MRIHASRGWLGAAAAALLVWSGCAPVESQAALTEPAGVVIGSARCIDAMPDTDADGLADACELQLALAFAPLLMTHSTRCTLPSTADESHIPGGYFHAAQPVRGAVRLVYMPAYFRDCGWSGPACLLVNCADHAGDSELIVVDVRQRQSGGWYTDAVFLSAHCFGRIKSDCRWYRAGELDAFAWLDIDRGAPVVWVSDARNANYPSYDACERGHLGIDGCQRPAVPYRFPVIPQRNIGSRAVPLVERSQPPGCVSGAFVEPVDRLIVGPSALECFWNRTVRFRGWQDFGDGATPYGEYLHQLGL